MKLTNGQKRERAFQTWLLREAGLTRQTLKFAELQERVRLVAKFNTLWEKQNRRVQK